MIRLIGKNHLEMILPASFQGVTQHHMNFISFDELDTVKGVNAATVIRAI